MGTLANLLSISISHFKLFRLAKERHYLGWDINVYTHRGTTLAPLPPSLRESRGYSGIIEH